MQLAGNHCAYSKPKAPYSSSHSQVAVDDIGKRSNNCKFVVAPKRAPKFPHRLLSMTLEQGEPHSVGKERVGQEVMGKGTCHCWITAGMVLQCTSEVTAGPGKASDGCTA